MTHSDQMMLRRLTGAKVRIGRDADSGPIYRLTAYDSTAQTFTAQLVSLARIPGSQHTACAVDVLQAKRDGILHILR